MPDEHEVLLKAGGEMDSCSVCLRVFGDDLDPPTITAMLGVEPTSSCCKGDHFRGKRTERIEKTGKWLLEIDWSTEVLLEALINQLLDSLTNDLTVWQELVRQYEIDLFCGLSLKSWNRGLTLSPRTLVRIGERGLELNLDIYFMGEDEA